jgi:hypothetical protein
VKFQLISFYYLLKGYQKQTKSRRSNFVLSWFAKIRLPYSALLNCASIYGSDTSFDNTMAVREFEAITIDTIEEEQGLERGQPERAIDRPKQEEAGAGRQKLWPQVINDPTATDREDYGRQTASTNPLSEAQSPVR